MLDIKETFEYNDVSNINRFVAYKNPFRYRGYYYDFETGLYYLNSRYYDPEIVKYARIMHCFIGPDGVDAIVKKNKPQAIKSLVKNSLYSSIRFNLYNFGNGIIFR